MTRHRPKPELVPRTCLLWHMADADCSMSDFHLGGREGGGELGPETWDTKSKKQFTSAHHTPPRSVRVVSARTQISLEGEATSQT